MKTIKAILIAAIALVMTACGGEKEGESESSYSFKLVDKTLTMQVGGKVTLEVRNVIDGITFGLYDYSQDKMKIKFSSSNTEVVNVDAKGVVTAVANGSAKISASSLVCNSTQTVEVTVGVRSDIGTGAMVTDVHTFTQDLGQALTKDMVFLSPGIIKSSQGLDIDKDGNRYVSWETNGNVTIACVPAGDTKSQATMTCMYGGHGDGFCVENTTDGVYVWTVGGLGDSGGYAGGKASTTDARVVCRYKYQAGKTVYPEDAIDCFYINTNGARCMSVDQEHNQFGIWTYDGKDILQFYTYSEVLSAPYTSLEIVRSDKKAATIKAHDLNKIKPLGSFYWDRKTYCGVTDGSTNAVQGYCIYDGKAYILSGYKDSEYSAISIVDTKGNWSATRTPLGITADKNNLVTVGVSGNGYLEPEGVQIHYGKMYLVFMGSGYSEAPTTRTSIIQLK